MTAKEALNLKVGDIVTPVYGLDKGLYYKITKIEQNPYCKKRVEVSITAVPLEPCKPGSSWRKYSFRCCQQQGWKTITKEDSK